MGRKLEWKIGRNSYFLTVSIIDVELLFALDH